MGIALDAYKELLLKRGGGRVGWGASISEEKPVARKQGCGVSSLRSSHFCFFSKFLSFTWFSKLSLAAAFLIGVCLPKVKRELSFPSHGGLIRGS